jgi:hypothetical protein
MEEATNPHKLLSCKILKERYNLGDLGLEVRILLKYVLKIECEAVN